MSVSERDSQRGSGIKFEINKPVLVTPLVEGVAVPLRGGTGKPRSSSELMMFATKARLEAEVRAQHMIRTRRN